MRPVTIGFRAKTARAISVALAPGNSEPAYIARWEISLCDPAFPPTSQPHHEVMELPWDDALSAVRPIEARIEKVAIKAVASLVKELRSKDCKVDSVGVVGSPDRSLERIGNPHIRAHAAEGILFRHCLEVAAAAHDIQWRSFSDRSIDEIAAAELHRQPQEIKTVLDAIGRSAGKPWRADERAAATAAWLALRQLFFRRRPFGVSSRAKRRRPGRQRPASRIFSFPQNRCRQRTIRDRGF